MPKGKNETVVAVENGWETVELAVTQRDETKIARYSRPANPNVFQEYVLNLTDTPAKDGEESPLARAYRLFVRALEREARDSVYESLAQESTYITVNKQRINLMDFPLDKLIRGINGMRRQFALLSETTGADEDSIKGFAAWNAAARKLVEEGKAVENAAGELEAVATA